MKKKPDTTYLITIKLKLQLDPFYQSWAPLWGENKKFKFNLPSPAEAIRQETFSNEQITNSS